MLLIYKLYQKSITFRCRHALDEAPDLFYQGCDLTKAKNPKKWEGGLGFPLVRGTNPPEPPGCLILEDLQTLHKQETIGLDIIQVISFFPW